MFPFWFLLQGMEKKVGQSVLISLILERVNTHIKKNVNMVLFISVQEFVEIVEFTYFKKQI